MTNAPIRANGESMKGSAAMSGAIRILPIVIAFGRFNLGVSEGPAANAEETRRGREHELGESFEDQLADSLQCIENSVSSDRYRLEVWRFFHPFPARQLVDEVLARVVRVGGDAGARRIRGLPSGIQRRLEVGYWCGVRKIALVVLDHERNARYVVPVLREVVVE